MISLRPFWDDDRGATSVEYAMIAFIVTTAIFVAATSIGGSLNTKFQAVATKVQ